jgi:predicted acetyltransferase
MLVLKADGSYKKVIENLMQLYLYDLSVYTGKCIEVNGLFDLGKYFKMYWTEQDRYPYLCTINDIPVGFALVRELAKDSYAICEFFILHSYRRKGIATQFAHHVFNLHHGKWQVAQIESNTASQVFWRKTISTFTRNNFIEDWSDAQPKGPKQVFNANPRK